MEKIRIGLVGAGANTRDRHIPGFLNIEGVELVSVCNRSAESSKKVADQFGISKVYDSWTELVSADDTDAICIGTWPYLHCPMTLAVLEANKHVLTEARMALDVDEARSMLAISRTKPDLVAQIVPAPFTLKFDETIRNLISDGYLGDIVALDLRGNSSSFVDLDGPLHWRQNRNLSGYNILNMGIWYECLMRWVGPASSVQAMMKVNVKHRRDEEGLIQSISVPDHVDILCDMVCGAQAHLSFSAVTGLGRSQEAWLYGSKGTLHLDMGAGVLKGGQKGDSGLEEIKIDKNSVGGWRVEEEFIRAIRGEEKITHTSFDDGVSYMEFTEAVTRSAQNSTVVALPL